MKRNVNLRLGTLAVTLGLCFGTTAYAETVKLAVIDPLSGTFAALGENQLRTWEYIADLANKEGWGGKYQLEVVGFDNKAGVQDSLSQLKRAIDQGYRFVAQANGSGVAFALVDAINKHNARNPGKEVVYLNHGAIDPGLTNDQCSFWQFSVDSNVDMKMQALVNHLAKNKDVKKVYIIGQNYAFGRSVSKAAKEMLAEKRPDVEIVGDDLHPIGEVKDFSPYVAKIIASGADTVITGNWGTDLALLIRAARDAGLDADFYTYYAVLKGSPTAIGESGLEHVNYVGVWNVNNEDYKGRDLVEGFKEKYDDDLTWLQAYSGVALLTNAMKKADSDDPVDVAFALEGMELDSLNGKIKMRAADHQLQQPLYIATWSKTNDSNVQLEQEDTGFGWRTEEVIPAEQAELPTICKMKRPQR
ncbi:branched-chain amino acid ABC transporter substrate-binding protein [Castellaniella sp.]|uniref:branched-chain amino acid ABC transporter substrate-binding protein n=1 Tax=Castellaniella sp. TaxID=1955812 RepID=UPI00355F8B7D